MLKQIEIRKPVTSVLKSPPSSLGTICYNMVLFEKEHEPAFQQQMKELAENIDDQEDYYPFFLLHSTTSSGDSIDPLGPRSQEETQFRMNQTSVDSVLLFHCLACRHLESDVLLKSGFHSWPVQESSDNLRPSCWDSMNRMKGDIHFSVKVDYEKFWRAYRNAVTEWNAETVGRGE